MALIKGVYDLKAFQEAYALVLIILPLTDEDQNDPKLKFIHNQMRRASTSVCKLLNGFEQSLTKTQKT